MHGPVGPLGLATLDSRVAERGSQAEETPTDENSEEGTDVWVNEFEQERNEWVNKWVPPLLLICVFMPQTCPINTVFKHVCYDDRNVPRFSLFALLYRFCVFVWECESVSESLGNVALYRHRINKENIYIVFQFMLMCVWCHTSNISLILLFDIWAHICFCLFLLQLRDVRVAENIAFLLPLCALSL